MISQTELNERVQQWGMRPEVVEKDYVIGWVLWGIGSDPELADWWAFKGGHLPEEVLPGRLPLLGGPGLHVCFLCGTADV